MLLQQQTCVLILFRVLLIKNLYFKLYLRPSFNNSQRCCEQQKKRLHFARPHKYEPHSVARVVRVIKSDRVLSHSWAWHTQNSIALGEATWRDTPLHSLTERHIE